MGRFTTLLFARPSFLEGAARVFDFGNSLHEYNRSDTPEEADSLAIASDWAATGNDLRAAITEYRAELERAQRVRARHRDDNLTSGSRREVLLSGR